MTLTTTPSEPFPKKRNWRPYVVGLLLSYALCFVASGRVFVAGASWHLGVALVGALFFWPFVAAAHLGVQFLLALAVRAFWDWGKRHQMPLLNAPITALTVFAAIHSYAHALRESQVAFKHFVQDPIPNSVRISQFGRIQGIGETLKLGLAFETTKEDLGDVLRAGGYAPAEELTNLDAELLSSHWPSGSCGIRFDDQVTRVLYVSTNDNGKHLLIRTNHPEVIFFYGKPYQ